MVLLVSKIKGIKNDCPCIVEIRGTQGCSQGKTTSVYDSHSARATIRDPFYNMECKIIKKNKTN